MKQMDYNNVKQKYQQNRSQKDSQSGRKRMYKWGSYKKRFIKS